MRNYDILYIYHTDEYSTVTESKALEDKIHTSRKYVSNDFKQIFTFLNGRQQKKKLLSTVNYQLNEMSKEVDFRISHEIF